MIDSYAIFSIVVRIIASLFLLMVFRKQISLWNRNGGALRKFKILLMAGVAILFTANVFSIIVNFYRGQDGNLIEDVRHINQVFNATSALAIAYVMYLIYDYHEK